VVWRRPVGEQVIEVVEILGEG
ncbi:transcription elongation factor GreAB, partial [Pseudomonas plecoglossicida]